MEESMTATESARLADWLKSKGLSDREVIECIKYIATGIRQEDKPANAGK